VYHWICQLQKNVQAESSDEEYSESSDEEVQEVQKKPARKKIEKFNVDSSDDDGNGDGTVSDEEANAKRDKNDAAWFKQHEGDLSKDYLCNVMDAPSNHPSHQQNSMYECQTLHIHVCHVKFIHICCHCHF